MRRTSVCRRGIVALLLVLCFGCVPLQSQARAADFGVIHFDARWWRHANSDEQQGFIYGYGDCRQPVNRPTVSIVDEQTFVSKALDSHEAGTPTSVTAAIQRAWNTLKSQKLLPGAEVFSGPHGYLDGEWWGGFDGPWPSYLESADRGYLEGYLECSSAHVTSEAVRRYQVAINHHYASGRHSPDKIADVLQSLLR
jgi:hypothetical protein